MHFSRNDPLPVPWPVAAGCCVLCMVVVGFLAALVVAVVVVMVVGAGWLGVEGLAVSFGGSGAPVLSSTGGATGASAEVNTRVTIFP